MREYSVTTKCGSTGYERYERFNNIKDVEEVVKQYRYERSYYIRVIDYDLKKTVYYKSVGHLEPDTDYLFDYKRDFRTTDRKVK